MLMIIEHWENSVDEHVNNVLKILWLIILKAVMDTLCVCMCVQGWRSSFFGLCSFSIMLIDWLTMFLMASAFLLGFDRFPLSPCFLLANASAMFAEVPQLMVCFGILDYCLDETCIGSRRPLCKLLRNQALVLLVWAVAGFHCAGSVNSELMEVELGDKFLVCSLEEVPLIANFGLLLFGAVVLAMLPFVSQIIHWVKEANRLTKARDNDDIKTSNLFDSNVCEKGQSCEKDFLQGNDHTNPPLWFSLTLAFALFWMPYLTISVLTLLCDVRLPAYFAVNLLWLECVNSVVVGIIFWVRSGSTGPYSNLPENTCLWRVYWDLSRGKQPQSLSVYVLNTPKENKNTILSV